VTAGRDLRWFVTVDDLAARLRSSADSLDVAYGRLRSALRTARAIYEAGALFVVAPVRTADGDVVRLRRLLERRDQLAAQARRRPDRMVPTHGEPHQGNFLQVGSRWMLVDWDTVLIAPPERDLWLLDPGDGSIADTYRQATGRVVVPSMLDLYQLGALRSGQLRRPVPPGPC
jgi:Phosphotransferase enzyme family